MNIFFFVLFSWALEPAKFKYESQYRHLLSPSDDVTGYNQTEVREDTATFQYKTRDRENTL